MFVDRTDIQSTFELREERYVTPLGFGERTFWRYRFYKHDAATQLRTDKLFS